MKSKKNNLILLLAALIAASSVVSCGAPVEDQSVGSDNESAVDQSKTEETDGTEETENPYIDLLPDANYDGYTFNILSTNPDELWGFMVSIYAEEETGEPLNDGVFRRNVAIEDRYNITIANTAELGTGGTSDTAKKLAMSGDETYSIVSYAVKTQLADALNGCFVNLHSIDTIDFENPWWNEEAVEMLTLYNKLFVGISEMNVFNNEMLAGIFVNNDQVLINQMESPYDLVREGKWTLDKMYEMEVKAARDMDGNTEMSEGDVVGFVGGAGSFNFMLTGANQPHIMIGEDGSYILNQGTEGSIAAAEKITKIINDKNAAAYRNDQSWAADSFSSGNALFREGNIADLSVMRDLDISLAVLPSPKFDELQEQYRTMLSNQSMPIAILKSNKNLDKTGVICEALGAYSIPIRDNYIESILMKKSARDKETVEMLNIIFDSKVIDVGVMNETAFGAAISAYTDEMRKSGTEKLASTGAVTKKLINIMLQEIEDTYAGLE